MFVYWVLFSFFFVVVKLKCWWQFSQLITHADIDLIIRNVYSELNTSSHSSIDFVSTANDLAAAQLMSSIPSRVISNYYICVWKIRWSFLHRSNRSILTEKICQLPFIWQQHQWRKYIGGKGKSEMSERVSYAHYYYTISFLLAQTITWYIFMSWSVHVIIIATQNW